MPNENSEQKLSIFIIAHNEEDRIGRTLNSITDLSDDIVVVDSGSTDRTREVASSLGAKVIINEWPGYGPQKKFAEQACQHEWVLNLDADEVPSQKLKDEIRSLLRTKNKLADAYRIRMVEILPGERKAHPFAHSHNYVRLYRRSKGSFSNSTVHDTVIVENGSVTGQLAHSALHYSMRNTTEQIRKFNDYSTLLAKDRISSGKQIPAWRIFFELPIGFLKAYFVRMYFARGTVGFIVSMNYAIFRYLRLAKYFELKRDAERRGA